MNNPVLSHRLVGRPKSSEFTKPSKTMSIDAVNGLN